MKEASKKPSKKTSSKRAPARARGQLGGGAGRGIPLNSAQAHRALQRVAPHLSSAVLKQARDLASLLEPDGTVRVSAVHAKLFPLATREGASAQLSNLLGTLVRAASDNGLLLGFDYKGAKCEGIANRCLFFIGAKPVLKANPEGLIALRHGELVEGQRGQVQSEPLIILVTFNEHEYEQLRNVFHPRRQPPMRQRQGVTVDDLGVHGNSRVLHYHSPQGSNQAQRAITDVERAFEPLAIIAVGIAFGLDEHSQALSDVLVSTYVCPYEVSKAHADGRLTLQGPRPPASPRLAGALRHLDQRQCNGPQRTHWPKVVLGGLLSGEKLIDDRSFREELQRLSGQNDLVGGEMEAAGLYAALHGRPVDWVVVKAICDWGDGTKEHDKVRRQRDAAFNAATVVKALLDQYLLYAGPGGEDTQDARRGIGEHAAGRPREFAARPDMPDLRNIGPFVETVHGALVDLNHLNLARSPTQQIEPKDRRTVTVLEDILNWQANPNETPLYALLADSGFGKTLTCQRVAEALDNKRAQGQATLIPLYFDLRKVEQLVAASDQHAGRVPTLQETIEDCLRHSFLQPDGTAPSYQDVIDAIDAGALVIFDGLDEVLSRLSEAQGLRFTSNLLRVIPDAAERRKSQNVQGAGAARPPRVLMSCRTQFFRNLAEQNGHLTGEHRGPSPASQYRALLLQPFTEEQIHRYLQSAFPKSDSAALLQQIESVHNLRQLAARPFTLKLVAQFIPQIEQWRMEGRHVTGATLYRAVAREWLIRDKHKQSFRIEDKERIAGDLAAYLWGQGQRGLSAPALEAWLDRWLAAQDRNAYFQNRPRELLHEDLRNATFLKRSDGKSPTESRFEFAHTSLQEFFLADHLLKALQTGEPGDGSARHHWALPAVSDETLDFLGQLLADDSSHNTTDGASALDTLSSWRTPYLKRASEMQLDYARRAHEQGWPCPIVAGMDLQGADLTEWHFGSQEEEPAPAERFDMSRVNLQGARLRRARFWHVLLIDARFNGAAVTQTEFLGCQAEGSDWHEADIAGAIFRHTRMGPLEVRALDAPPSNGLAVSTARFIDCPGLPVSAAERSATDVRLALHFGHLNSVRTCAFSPDGRWILSAAHDRTLRVWEAATGECLRLLRGHESSVSSCAFSPNGRWMASAAHDGTLRVWEAATGKCLRLLRGHERSVSSCAFSPDGRWIVSAAHDGTLRVWEAATSECLRVLRGHESSVLSCAFSPDGRWIVSAAYDDTLRVWEAATGECLRVLLNMKGGSAAWEPATNTLLHAQGRAWRFLAWEGRRCSDDQPARWPLEAGPTGTQAVVVRPWHDGKRG